MTDSAGGTHKDTLVLTVLEPPTASLEATAGAADSSSWTVSFNGSDSTAPQGYELVQWVLHYGDGRVDQGTGAPGAPMEHTYARGGGPYTAQLTVSDSSGGSHSTAVEVAEPGV